MRAINFSFIIYRRGIYKLKVVSFLSNKARLFQFFSFVVGSFLSLTTLCANGNTFLLSKEILGRSFQTAIASSAPEVKAHLETNIYPLLERELAEVSYTSESFEIAMTLVFRTIESSEVARELAFAIKTSVLNNIPRIDSSHSRRRRAGLSPVFNAGQNHPRGRGRISRGFMAPSFSVSACAESDLTPRAKL